LNSEESIEREIQYEDFEQPTTETSDFEKLETVHVILRPEEKSAFLLFDNFDFAED
jgi:hypothetical protein